MSYKFKFLICLFCLLNLAGCDVSSSQHLAPVSDRASIESIPSKGLHRVRAHETLYSIAWRYGLNYQDLAKWNNIDPPYHIYRGEKIILVKVKQKNVLPHIEKMRAHKLQQYENHLFAQTALTWGWPAHGVVVDKYSQANKGINIAGQLGEPIYSSAAGKVVYAGAGIRGYGNLIIIKHNSQFLTAYGHNKKNLVKEGDWVKMGDTIALMGNVSAKRVILHFEMRKNGLPVNPLVYLH